MKDLCHHTKINFNIQNNYIQNNIYIKFQTIMKSFKKKILRNKFYFKNFFEKIIDIKEFNTWFQNITKVNRIDYYQKILKQNKVINNNNVEKYNKIIIYYYKFISCILINFDILFDNKNDKNKNILMNYITSLQKNYIFDYINIDNKLINKEIIPEQMKDSGIIINGNIIKKISGPVSFYYLKPINKNKSRYFPLIILFGDAHFSKKFICNNSKNGHYTISNEVFLKLLDELVYDDNYPVDFYTETFLTGLKSNINGFMHNLTTKEMITCYHKELKGKGLCPTKKIRWHAGDPRQSFMFLENLNKDFINMHKKNAYMIQFLEKFQNDMFIEGQLDMLFTELYHLFKFIKDNILVKKLKEDYNNNKI